MLMHGFESNCQLLRSTKAVERKKGAESLMEGLNDGEIVKILGQNSCRTDHKTKFTWTNVFEAVEVYFAKETEKLLPSHYGNLLKNSVFNVVFRVVKRAISEVEYLPWQKIYDFINKYLQQHVYATVYGVMLVNMLQDFISRPLYVTAMYGNSWSELIQLLISLHGKYSISPSVILENLNICITHGSDHPSVIAVLRHDVVRFYQNSFQMEERLRPLMKPYLKGLILLCRKNAVEFRGILCKLGETIIPKIIQTSSFSEDEDAAIVDFLLAQMILHTPCDVTYASPAYFADDSAKWTEIVGYIYSFCIDAIDDISKKKANDFHKDLQVPNALLLLTVKCTKQVCEEREAENSGHGHGPNKKAMSHRSFYSILNDTCKMHASESQIIWLNYLTAVVREFPYLISTTYHFTSLFNLGLSLLSSAFVARGEVYTFFHSLFFCEKHLLNLGVYKQRSNSWDHVWDVCIKSLSVNQGKLEATELLRSILVELQPSSITSLLLLFVNRAVPANRNSLLLLAEYLASCSLPLVVPSSSNSGAQNIEIQNSICPRLALIRWLICAPDKSQSENAILVAKIVSALLVKRSHIVAQAEVYKKFCFRIIVHEECEKMLLKSCFVDIPTNNYTANFKIPIHIGISARGALTVVNSVAYNFVESLQEDFDTVSAFDKRMVDLVKKFSQVQYRVILHLSVVNTLQKYNVGAADQLTFKTNMEKLFDRSFTRYVEIIIDYMTRGAEKSPDQICSLLSTIRILLRSDHLCEETKAFFAQRFPQQLQEILKKIFRSSLARYLERATNNAEAVMFSTMDIVNKGYLTSSGVRGDVDEAVVAESRRCELASREALRCLVDYGIICDHRAELFLEIIKDLCAETFHLANVFLFDLCSDLICRLAPLLRQASMADLVTPVMTLLQSMCRGYYMHAHCTMRLWQVFQEVIEIISHDTEANKKNLMTLVGALSCVMKTNQPHGTSIKVNNAAFKMLSELAKYDRSLSWAVYTPKTGDPTWVLQEAYNFLGSKSHQIRLYAVDTVCNVFLYATPPTHSQIFYASQSQLSVHEANFDKRRQYYDNLFPFLLETFNIPSSLTPDEIVEEGVNRTAIALACLTRLIFAYPFIKKKTLFSLYMMVKIKGIKVELAHRALKQANPSAAKTMICYVSYILEKWLKLNYSIEDFPYQFFDCDNLRAFHIRFKREISVQFFEQNNMRGLEEFANTFNLSGSNFIKNECFGMIMARLSPGLAIHMFTESGGSVSRYQNISLLNESHKRLISILGGKSVTENLMLTNLGDVILHLLSMAFDSTIPAIWGCLEIRLPAPEPPHFDEESIHTSLRFLAAASSQRNNMSIISYLVRSSPKNVYKILLTLMFRVHEAHDLQEKFWRLYHFSLFVKLLIQEPPTVFDQMKEYVCQFVIHAYLRLLSFDNERSSDLVQVTVFLLTEFIQHIADKCCTEMSIYFYPVISGLVSTVFRYPHLIKVVKKPLDLLLKSQNHDFTDSIISLDPFPANIPEFRDYRAIHNEKKYGNRRNEWPLQKELQSCLDELETSKAQCTKERLEFIRELLAKRKRDLEKLVKNLETKRFSDECYEDIIHNLIQMLISTILNSEDTEVTLEACRCLGEIGPVNLSVLVLPQHRSKTKLTSMINAISAIIETVAGYLTNDDIRLVATTGKVLQSLLEVTECSEILIKEIQVPNPRLGRILTPFRTSNPTAKSNGKILALLLESKLGLNEMNEHIEYSTWLTQLTCGLIDCIKPEGSLSARLLPLCKLKVEFCEDVIPFIVYVILYAGRDNAMVRKHLSAYFRNFFSKFTSTLSNTVESSRSVTPTFCTTSGGPAVSIFINKLALRCLLKVVQFLRLHSAPQELRGSLKLTPWDNNFWLDINYLDLSKAAQYCGAYLTSILFIEIYAQEWEMSGSTYVSQDEVNEDDSTDQFYSQGTTLYPRNRGEAGKIEKLLLKAYTSVGEPDAVYGCGSARFSDFQSNIQHLQQRKLWVRTLSAYDTEASSDIGVCQSLKELVLYNTLWTYLEGVQVRDRGEMETGLTEIQYECGWRLAKWTLNCDNTSYIRDSSLMRKRRKSTIFQKYLYESIQAGLNKDRINHYESIQRGLKSIVKDLKHASLESSENLYDFLTQFQMFRVIEDFFSTGEMDLIENFMQKWKLHDKISCSSFKFEEPILYLRSILLRSFDERHPSVNLESAYDECMLELLSKARDSGRLEFAEICATSIGSSEKSARKDIEIAKNHWARGDQDIGRHILGRLIKRNNPDNCDFYASMLLLYGEWLCQTMAERSSIILEKYLLRSLRLLENKSRSAQLEISKANFIIAKYSDAQYQIVNKYMRSELFVDKVNLIDKSKQELRQSSTASDSETKRSTMVLRKQSTIDYEEVQATINDKKKLLLLALKHYLRGLNNSNDHDLLIFRAIALWMENATDDGENASDANKIVAEEKMPSYKYIVVLHQLSARMSISSKGMSILLNTILIRCAQEHPFHTVPVLLTQSLLHKDQELIRTNYKKHIEVNRFRKDRVKAAGKLVDNLKRDSALGVLTQKMEKLWVALISLANVQESKNTDGLRKSIPNTAPLRTLKGLEEVSVPTTYVPVSPSGNYKDIIIGIHSFESFYQLVGGMNSPKRISCLGTNGSKFNMLLKGQDDLRQDAVMQQVFAVMNKLLLAEPATKTRRLQVRTYKVVPLSQRSGIIEWCENTQTFGDYLVGSEETGAHSLYRPTDYKPSECRRKMNEVKDCRDNEKKLGAYMTIGEHFKPVFRHFFFENFKEAGIFFERRLAYTRSVATSSMVGYILGLGDRHVLNILVDKTTAEFIHIDLGVAFEQGRILPTPETIPFRLTRDVVDGMGVSGVEGVFRKSCEMTMGVLRTNAEIILTILEVLLYDPLYIWTLTADRMLKVQPAEPTRVVGRKPGTSVGATETPEDVPKERNSSAARVLLRLKQKLVGIEEGGSSSLSVSGHVSLLIQRAMDPERLSRLFPGWQPYL